jgi:hypothetical protein
MHAPQPLYEYQPHPPPQPAQMNPASPPPRQTRAAKSGVGIEVEVGWDGEVELVIGETAGPVVDSGTHHKTIAMQVPLNP